MPLFITLDKKFENFLKVFTDGWFELIEKLSLTALSFYIYALEKNHWVLLIFVISFCALFLDTRRKFFLLLKTVFEIKKTSFIKEMIFIFVYGLIMYEMAKFMSSIAIKTN